MAGAQRAGWRDVTRILIRADASLAIGTGHVMRMATLARGLADRGATVEFACRAHSGNLVDHLRQAGFKVHALPVAGDVDADADTYARWLGVSEAEDARQTCAAVGNASFDWVVADHYGLGARWHGAMRERAGRIMAVDDLANRKHECDLLLDQNFAKYGACRYAGLVPEACLALTGPRYALLSPAYAQARANMAERGGEVERVLVFFGGAAGAGPVTTALEALCDEQLGDIDIDLVLGRDIALDIERFRARRTGAIEVHRALPHLADLMARADLAVGAGGATTWERLCLGVPSVVLPLAANQEPACKALGDAGMIVHAGEPGGIEAAALAETIRRLCRDEDARRTMAARGAGLVDGNGLRRVVEALLPTPSEELMLRPAGAQDVLTYLTWANDPAVRRHSINGAPISEETHRRWFAEQLGREDRVLLVLEASGEPVGQIRFDARGGFHEINYSLDRAVRGRGWARELVARGCTALAARARGRLRARVKPDNEASVRVFRDLGFEPLPDEDGLLCFAASLSAFRTKISGERTTSGHG